MEKRVILSKRFQKNAAAIYQYLIKNHSARIACQFLDRLQQRIDLIRKHSEIGSLSQKKNNVGSLSMHPHNRIYYQAQKSKIELLCIADMRRKNKPY